MTIHKEGSVSIILALILALTLSALTYLYSPCIYLSAILYAFFLLFFVFIIHFFRYPKRAVSINGHHIIAPADGKVVVVEEIDETEYFNDRRIQVSIFMSPLNVHSNHYPLSGKVVYSKYHAGRHMVASHPKSSTLNERHSVVVQHDSGKEVLFKQVAGTVARRIVCYSKEGDEAVQGGNYGFIKFGSRVDIILPLDAKINVTLDNKTRSRQTVIATI